MKGAEVIQKLNEYLTGEELIVSSNGNVSRQAYNFLPQPQVYLRGSMGLPVSIGLGLAISQPKKKVIVITGDGNFLMGLSSVTTVGFAKQNNLRILIIDNESYATTGCQETVSSALNYGEMVKGMGIESVMSIDLTKEKEMTSDLLDQFVNKEELQVLHIRVEIDDINLENIPWHPIEIKENFQNR
ncbi:MAG: hypothetical protein H7645_11325 [Candidatus Heimdallarchaeota archaeon]|nr:hypothetical protein [Candidatus Heimdallarchaeota archaeon]MCK4770915.1 hypothetical protein [Candidatus Heimdallarchaeota archaeon]